MNEDNNTLRLLAENTDDLAIISATLQDAVIKAENIRYNERARRFTLELNRYRWENGDVRGTGERVRSLLAVDGVLSVKSMGLRRDDPDLVYALLASHFEPDLEPPGGILKFVFAGDGVLALNVEVLDVSLLDSGYVWPTRHKPKH